MNPTFHRRRAALALGAASLLALTACGGNAPPAEDIDLGTEPAAAGTVQPGVLDGMTLTFASYGGIYQDGQMEAAGIPFGEESGATILSDGPMEYSKIQAQVQSNNVTWDVVDMDSTWAAGQCGDNLQKLDFEIIDVADVPEELVSDCYVPAMQYANVMMYDVDKYGENGPQTWEDFFDVEKFPGKRAINGGDVGPILEGALLADGVPREEIYPLDVDRALKKLDTIKDHFIFWSTGAESQQMIESGDADIAFMWNGRAYAGVKNGANYKPAWDTGVLVMDVLGVPTNAKNPKASMAFINYYLGKEQQEKLTELTSYAPINNNSKPELDQLAEEYLVSAPGIKEKLLVSDFAWWGENYPSALEDYLAWING
ncbi:MAG: polyamine ABC transporter substrate-binding protein [Arthrobacter sp.]|uniref:polyamine ABC transporter substrate-binding protein n=1 Tax=Arthrobacter sp. TaxID=1667 RepID=UPI0034823C59